jgi:cyclophilin family peptidyl-prolyl cis-trans isomerase
VLGLAVAAVVVGAAVFLLGKPFGGPAASSSPSPAGSQTPLPTRILTGCPTAAPAGAAVGTKRTVTIDTPLGDIVLEVDADLAPVAAANFIALAECDYFNGVVFHRVIPDFVIQGGDGQYAWSGGIDRENVGTGGPGYAFADEPVIGAYTRGTVAMANSGANTNGSQFFIVVKDLSDTDLEKKYTIFGRVTAGMDIVDKIVSAPRDSQDFPNDPVPMTTVSVAPAPSPAPSAAPSASASPAPGPTSSPEQPQP